MNIIIEEIPAEDIEITCAICGHQFTLSNEFAEAAMELEGEIWCDRCTSQEQAIIIAQAHAMGLE